MSQNVFSLLILWTYLAIEYRRAHHNQIQNEELPTSENAKEQHRVIGLFACHAQRFFTYTAA